MMDSVRKRIDDLRDGLAASLSDNDHHTVTLRLTLVLVGFYGVSGAEGAVVKVIVGAMLAFPRLLRQQGPWWALAVILCAGNIRQWELVDNHQYLIGYWVIACALSLRATQHAVQLTDVSRVLIGLVFGFAVIWKIVAAQYVDGSFWYWTAQTDPRLLRALALSTGSSLTDVVTLTDAAAYLGTNGAAGDGFRVSASPGVRTVTLVLSWAALVLEAGVGGLALVGGRYWFQARQIVLMVFAALTYVLMPVMGFAFVLLLLGFAQCEASDTRLKVGYLLLLAGIQLAALPWIAALTSVAQAVH